LKKSTLLGHAGLIENIQKLIMLLKTGSSVALIAMATFFPLSLFAQNDKDKSISTSKENGIAQQMFDFSRPGRYHQLLGELEGKWTFKGRRFPLDPESSNVKFDLYGTQVRNSFAEGRYFILYMTMGDSLHKVLIPIKNGNSKEVIGQGIAIEGYDNVKQKFIQAGITNHIGSDIIYWEGTYDSTTRTIAFNSVQEIVPGVRDTLRQLFIIHDKDSYTIEYYYKEKEVYVKTAEVYFKRDR
jgi:hypothetical protein